MTYPDRKNIILSTFCSSEKFDLGISVRSASASELNTRSRKIVSSSSEGSFVEIFITFEQYIFPTFYQVFAARGVGVEFSNSFYITFKPNKVHLR